MSIRQILIDQINNHSDRARFAHQIAVATIEKMRRSETDKDKTYYRVLAASYQLRAAVAASLAVQFRQILLRQQEIEA